MVPDLNFSPPQEEDDVPEDPVEEDNPQEEVNDRVEEDDPQEEAAGTMSNVTLLHSKLKQKQY